MGEISRGKKKKTLTCKYIEYFELPEIFFSDEKRNTLKTFKFIFRKHKKILSCTGIFVDVRLFL